MADPDASGDPFIHYALAPPPDPRKDENGRHNNFAAGLVPRPLISSLGGRNYGKSAPGLDRKSVAFDAIGTASKLKRIRLHHCSRFSGRTRKLSLWDFFRAKQPAKPLSSSRREKPQNRRIGLFP